MFWNFIKYIFGFRSIDDALNKTKKVIINGVRFEIKKIDPLDHARGLQVIRKTLDLYQIKTKENKKELSDADLAKIRKHYRDVFLAGVVRPVLSLDGSGTTCLVDDIFKDELMSEKLYMEIMALTYGKKKLKSSIMLALTS